MALAVHGVGAALELWPLLRDRDGERLLVFLGVGAGEVVALAVEGID